MDYYRPENASRILRGSRGGLDDDHVRSLEEERMSKENTQTNIIVIIKIGLVLLALISIPIVYSIISGSSVKCGGKPSFIEKTADVFRQLFGLSKPDPCKKEISTEVTTDSKMRIETTTETTTCNLNSDQKTDIGGNNSFWSMFRLPSWGCNEYKAQIEFLENQKPKVSQFKKQMPTFDEVKKNFSTLMKSYGDAANLPSVSENDVVTINELFNSLLIPYRDTTSSTQSAKEAKSKMSLESLTEFKTLFEVQKRANDLKVSQQNLEKKKEYIQIVRDQFAKSGADPKHCIEGLQTLEASLREERVKLNDKLKEKERLESKIQENQLKLNDYISQRNTREQEPIQIVQKLNVQLNELKFKLQDIPKANADLEKRRKAVAKAEEDLKFLELRLVSENENKASLNSRAHDWQVEINSFKQQVETTKIKLAMRRMKLELANSNYKIKEYLMSLIKHNKGEDVDLQSLFSTNENARNEIRKILKEFIGQSKNMEIEVSITDSQIDEIIQKDQEEFDAIRKMYSELVQIINQYGDFSMYIKVIATEISEFEKKLAHDEARLNELIKKLREVKHDYSSCLERIDSITAEISKLQSFVAQTNQFISEKVSELSQLHQDYESLKHEIENYSKEHKVS